MAMMRPWQPNAITVVLYLGLPINNNAITAEQNSVLPHLKIQNLNIFGHFKNNRSIS